MESSARIVEIIEIEDDEDAVIDLDDPEKTADDVIYDWDAEIRKRLAIFSLGDNENVLGELLREYLTSLQQIYKKYENNFMLVNRVACHLRFLHSYFIELQCCSIDLYLRYMEDILTVYCNLELQVFNAINVKEFKKKEEYNRRLNSAVKGIANSLNTYLLERQENQFHVLIKMQFGGLTGHGKHFLNTLYSQIFKKLPNRRSCEETFCRYYIVFQKWKEFQEVQNWAKMDEMLYKMFSISRESIKTSETLKKILMPSCESQVDVVFHLFKKAGDLADSYFNYFATKQSVTEVDDLDFNLDLDDDDEGSIMIDDDEDLGIMEEWEKMEKCMAVLSSSSLPCKENAAVSDLVKVEVQDEDEDEVQFVRLDFFPVQPMVEILPHPRKVEEGPSGSVPQLPPDSQPEQVPPERPPSPQQSPSLPPETVAIEAPPASPSAQIQEEMPSAPPPALPPESVVTASLSVDVILQAIPEEQEKAVAPPPLTQTVSIAELQEAVSRTQSIDVATNQGDESVQEAVPHLLPVLFSTKCTSLSEPEETATIQSVAESFEEVEVVVHSSDLASLHTVPSADSHEDGLGLTSDALHFHKDVNRIPVSGFVDEEEDFLIQKYKKPQQKKATARVKESRSRRARNHVYKYGMTTPPFEGSDSPPNAVPVYSGGSGHHPTEPSDKDFFSDMENINDLGLTPPSDDQAPPNTNTTSCVYPDIVHKEKAKVQARVDLKNSRQQKAPPSSSDSARKVAAEEKKRIRFSGHFEELQFNKEMDAESSVQKGLFSVQRTPSLASGSLSDVPNGNSHVSVTRRKLNRLGHKNGRTSSVNRVSGSGGGVSVNNNDLVSKEPQPNVESSLPLQIRMMDPSTRGFGNTQVMDTFASFQLRHEGELQGDNRAALASLKSLYSGTAPHLVPPSRDNCRRSPTPPPSHLQPDPLPPQLQTPPPVPPRHRPPNSHTPPPPQLQAQVPPPPPPPPPEVPRETRSRSSSPSPAYEANNAEEFCRYLRHRQRWSPPPGILKPARPPGILKPARPPPKEPILQVTVTRQPFIERKVIRAVLADGEKQVKGPLAPQLTWHLNSGMMHPRAADSRTPPEVDQKNPINLTQKVAAPRPPPTTTTTQKGAAVRKLNHLETKPKKRKTEFQPSTVGEQPVTRKRAFRTSTNKTLAGPVGNTTRVTTRMQRQNSISDSSDSEVI